MGDRAFPPETGLLRLKNNISSYFFLASAPFQYYGFNLGALCLFYPEKYHQLTASFPCCKFQSLT